MNRSDAACGRHYGAQYVHSTQWSTAMQMTWIHGSTFKALGIGFLALLMLIPLAHVSGLIDERQQSEQHARNSIAERWGGEQRVGGPVLVVPVRTTRATDKGWGAVEVREYALPEKLFFETQMTPELRRYRIYETPVYTAAISVHGHFSAASIRALSLAGDEVLWHHALLRVPVSDVRGIRQLSPLKLDGKETPFAPSTTGHDEISAAEVAWPMDPESLPDSIPFSFEMRLAGTESLRFLPLARQTDVSAAATWKDPSFSGAFLPAQHNVAADGFQATWQVLDLNRNYAQQGALGSLSLDLLRQSAFGVDLYQPADTYQRNVRAGKYGLLFVGLTFVALFLFEALGRWRVHPVQYVLVGLALCTFYLVLLAFSEQFGFAIAYALAAIAVILMVAGYATAAAKSRVAGSTLGAILAGVYALLYGLVISEQYSLLMGSLALLAAIALLMYLTRKIDWYRLGKSA
jgi:inner membrane protein